MTTETHGGEGGSAVAVNVTEYTVCALPGDDINAHSYAITVAYRGGGLWAVVRSRWCLGRDGEWDWEPQPSERTAVWLSGHRFPEQEALRLAMAAAPHVIVNGRSAAYVLSMAADA